MESTEERYGKSNMSELTHASDHMSPTTNDDILKEIKTTNEYLRAMIDKMDEILIYLKGNITIS